MVRFKTASPAQTQKIAKELADLVLGKAGKTNRLAGRLTSYLLPHKSIVIILKGDLGAGKTTFIQGFLRGLGVKSKITSPTFVLIKNYELRIMNYGNAYHVDCYRIKNPNELSSLGIKEIISNPDNIVLIEWPERIKKILPNKKISINLKHGSRENERKLSIH